MTKPISNERVTWLSDRLKVVEACVRFAQLQMYSMTSGGANRQDLQHALLAFSSERNAIMIELHVLREMGVTA